VAKKDYYALGSRHQFKERGEDLTIRHVPTGRMVVFPAFLDLFSDNFSSQWNAEDVYGRMDPIATFVNTRRSLSVAWWVPADSFEHAEENLAKANQLISFLYPLYAGKPNSGATVINQGPLMRVSFGNLIRNAKTGRGLLGYMNGFTFDPALEYGMFNRRGVMVTDPRLAGQNPQWNEYYPKTFRLNFEFNVLHEHDLGYRKSSRGKYIYNDPAAQINNRTFPYHTEKTPDESKKTSPEEKARLERQARVNRDPLKGGDDPNLPPLVGLDGKPLSRISRPNPDPNGPGKAGTFNIFGDNKD
jgi:hypothetical protein